MIASFMNRHSPHSEARMAAIPNVFRLSFFVGDFLVPRGSSVGQTGSRSGRSDGGGHDRAKQMIPTLEYHIDCHGPEMFEEPVGWPACDHRLAPCQHAEPRGGMECEGEHIERHQNTGQGFLAMPEIVFECIRYSSVR